MSEGETVALVHDSKRFDGLRVLLLGWASALRSSKWSPELYTCVDPSSYQEYAVDGQELRGRRVPLGRSVEMAANRVLGPFAKAIAGLPDGVVHVNSVHLMGAARRRKGVVVTVPDLAKRTTRYYPWGPSVIHNWLLRGLGSAAAVVTLTQWGRDDIVRVTGYPKDRISVVAPVSNLPPPPSPIPHPVEPPTDAHPWNLLCVAVDRPHKNVRTFLQLLARLGPSFRGTYVGRPSSATRTTIERLGLGTRLTVVSEVRDMGPIYAAADVLVFPSLYEGFGIPVLEAMGQGVPVVAARSTCLPEVVADGGLLVPPEDLDAWQEAILRLTEPGRHVAAQTSGLRRAREFTPQRSVAGLSLAYDWAS